MQRHPTPTVYRAVLHELDIRFQRYYHQSLNDIVQDLQLRNALPTFRATPEVLLSAIYHTGLLQMKSAQPVVEMRDLVARCVRGTLGTCLQCGREIADEELEKNPMRAFCSSCQALDLS